MPSPGPDDICGIAIIPAPTVLPVMSMTAEAMSARPPWLVAVVSFRADGSCCCWEDGRRMYSSTVRSYAMLSVEVARDDL